MPIRSLYYSWRFQKCFHFYKCLPRLAFFVEARLCCFVLCMTHFPECHQREIMMAVRSVTWSYGVISLVPTLVDAYAG